VANGITIPANATNVAISADGNVTATIPGNVTPQPIGTIALASFVNPAGLEPRGQNLFAETAASGQPLVGSPNSGSLGALQSAAVEESNIDLTGELVNMITAQRNYQANAQSIKAQDAVMQTLVNLR
jgi:flagellar basal-body rod protein FlgG